ncbi:MAG: hypothetical protein KDA87_08735 [Planctomycetales bacterium]|nr:hypothetical protein [Planctomycetales bacterium]
MNASNTDVPSPAEIRRQCRQIQATWSSWERLQRAIAVPCSYRRRSVKSPHVTLQMLRSLRWPVSRCI